MKQGQRIYSPEHDQHGTVTVVAKCNGFDVYGVRWDNGVCHHEHCWPPVTPPWIPSIVGRRYVSAPCDVESA